MPNVYEIVTTQFIEALKKDIVPWQKPWDASGEMPHNYATKKVYRGCNVMMLSLAQMVNGFEHPEWMTYNQAKDLGGQVKKGSKSTTVVFWSIPDKKKVAELKKLGKKAGIFLRYYNVFNVAQVEGLKDRKREPRKPVPILEACENVWSAYEQAPKLTHGGIQASYSPTIDRIAMPKRDLFKSPEAYYTTFFHEMIHSTGHESRLNRALIGNMKSGTYAKEELVAEIGAAFLATMCGIDVPSIVTNSQAYIKHWIQNLQDDEKLIVTAAGAAQKAVDRIQKLVVEAEEITEVEQAA